MSDAEEILRLRRRVHELRAENKAIGLRYEYVLTRIKANEDLLRELQDQVGGIVEADKIAQAVANELATREEEKSTSQKLGLTRSQFRFTVTFGLVTMALSIIGNLQAAGVL